MANFATSTQENAVYSTSAGVEATPGDEYQHYRETSSMSQEYYTDFDEYDEFIYPGYSFERPVYMYIWGILVIITFLANILVVYVLLRKKMRNPTNMILAIIAISDSLTGLVTLPSYWAVYSTFQPAENYNFDDNSDFKISDYYDIAYDYGITGESDDNVSSLTANETAHLNKTMSLSDYIYEPNDEAQNSYHLTKDLCRTFMISKYFISKMFHTMSIWLTLFLGFQRLISVASPFRAQRLFCERNVLIICVVVAVTAPSFHVYHLFDEKADSSLGMCQWALEENCAEGCAHLIITFVLRHLIPCILLVIFTVLFIIHLTKSSSRLSRTDSDHGDAAMQHRDRENRRVSLIVTLIVIIFLIPEVPYGGFLLYSLIGRFTAVSYDLETNRAIHLAYELSLVLSFHANFYIYTFFNKRFRKALMRGIVYPILTCCGRSTCCGIDKTKYLHTKKSHTTASRPSPS